MNENIRPVSFQQLCFAVDDYSKCMDDYLYAYDFKNDIYHISQRAVSRFRMDENTFSDVVNAHRDFVYADDYAMICSELQRMRSGLQKDHDLEYRWVSKQGQPIWIHCRGRVVVSGDTGDRFMIGCVEEIGQQQRADNTTGLQNESVLRDALNSMGDNSYPPGYFMHVGIDGFKDLAETNGGQDGDEILRELAMMIKECLKPGQNVYRCESDEFVIVDFAGGSIAGACELYRQIRHKIDERMESNQYDFFYTISAGLVDASEMEGYPPEHLHIICRFAMSMAKQNGKNQIYIFRESDYERFLWEQKLSKAMRIAINEDCKGFEVYFQPLMNLRTGKLYGAEALSRFFMDGQVISPTEFIPILEESGLIIPFGRFVMEQAVGFCSLIRKRVPNFHVSINLSYIQILKSAAADELIHIIENSDIPSDAIIVELTESGHLERTPSVRRAWNHLREYGVNIAIDDFGTGYSNFNYLDELRPDVLKIDRGFALQAIHNANMQRVLMHIIEAVHGFGMRVCIEGVETEDELYTICRMDPDYIQGFYYGRPCSKNAFYEQFVK